MNKLLGTVVQLAWTGIVVSIFLDTTLGKKVECAVVDFCTKKKQDLKEMDIL